MSSAIASALVQRIKQLTSVRKLREERYERVFATGAGFGHCRGVFRDFAEALRSAPCSARIGFDHQEFAGEFGGRFEQIFPHDYPMLFWLERCLRQKCEVFDLGGHTGSQFHAWRSYIDYPEGLRWTVCEVPAVVLRGRALAQERGYQQLKFTERPGDADGSDVLLSAGALQYVESPSLPVLLAQMNRKPMHLLLNKLPLYDGPGYVTLQNGGPVFIAQHVFNRAELISELNEVGYQLIDSWDVPGFSTQIPFWPERSVSHFSGLYLRAR
jgi:putative methyltransferase (TIGR04325 family)